MAWFAVRTGPSSFAIVDVFPDEAGRQAHLDGQVAAALIGKADELLAAQPADPARRRPGGEAAVAAGLTMASSPSPPPACSRPI